MTPRPLNARCIVGTTVAYCALALGGCNSWLAGNGPRELSDGLNQNTESSAATSVRERTGDLENLPSTNDAADTSTEPAKTQSPVDRFEELATAEWVLAPAIASDTEQLLNPFSEPTWASRRWRHAGLEAVLARADAAEQLRKAARSREQAVAVNAAIGMAQLDDASGTSVLADAALSDRLPRSMRGAAIESLAGLTTPKADAALSRVAGELAQWEGQARGRYKPELHADVIRAFSLRPRQQTAAAIAKAIRSPSAEVRYEAAGSYERLAGALELPENFADLVGDESAKVCAAAVRALAAHRGDVANMAVERALSDADMGVRIAAVHSLAELGGSGNHDRLRLLLDDSVELIRAAAVQGLVRLNDILSATQAANDKSWRVRLALAASLATMPPRYGLEVATQLVADADLKVQRCAVESLGKWPAADAIGLLLAAAERGSVLTRRAAIEQLQKRWPPAASFPRHAAPDRQMEELQRLAHVWKTESVGQHRTAAPERPESTAEDETRAIASVSALSAISLTDRRAAARNLAAEEGEGSLPHVALEKLSEFVEAETDGQIWIDVMAAIARSDSAAAERMASAAASHTNAEVRRRACGWFGAHPSDRGADVLVNSLNDQDASVVLAAAQALGMQPHLRNAEPLVSLLTADDHTLRVAAAESLARLHASEGMEALSRLTYDRDGKVRRLSATAIGNVYAATTTTSNASAVRVVSRPPSASAASLHEAHRAQLVADLVQLLDDRAEVRRAAVIALAKVTGEAPPKTAATAPRARGRFAGRHPRYRGRRGMVEKPLHGGKTARSNSFGSRLNSLASKNAVPATL